MNDHGLSDLLELGSCRHNSTPVQISAYADPTETVTVYCSRSAFQYSRKVQPDWGLYADNAWNPSNRFEIIKWPDFGVPSSPTQAFDQILDAFIMACNGKKVEIGCFGGHGRTGTIIACMFVLAGHPASDAVSLARTRYCPMAIETPEQEKFVRDFEKMLP